MAGAAKVVRSNREAKRQISAMDGGGGGAGNEGARQMGKTSEEEEEEEEGKEAEGD